MPIWRPKENPKSNPIQNADSQDTWCARQEAKQSPPLANRRQTSKSSYNDSTIERQTSKWASRSIEKFKLPLHEERLWTEKSARQWSRWHQIASRHRSSTIDSIESERPNKEASKPEGTNREWDGAKSNRDWYGMKSNRKWDGAQSDQEWDGTTS